MLHITDGTACTATITLPVIITLLFKLYSDPFKRQGFNPWGRIVLSGDLIGHRRDNTTKALSTIALGL